MPSPPVKSPQVNINVQRKPVLTRRMIQTVVVFFFTGMSLSCKTVLVRRWRQPVQIQRLARWSCWKTCASTWRRRARVWVLMAARSRPSQRMSRPSANPFPNWVTSMSMMRSGQPTEHTGRTHLWSVCTCLVGLVDIYYLFLSTVSQVWLSFQIHCSWACAAQWHTKHSVHISMICRVATGYRLNSFRTADETFSFWAWRRQRPQTRNSRF